MPVYSHSQLSVYEQCPLRYRLCYRDGIKRDMEGIEGFLGNVVHETLRKCYEDARLTKLNTLEDILYCYDTLWQKGWHEGIVITKKDVTAGHYHALGRRMVETYYQRHAPFDQDVTIGTEMRLRFSLDDAGRYRFQGLVDRLSRTPDGVHHINDYKTSAYLLSQEDVDNDRQLALYQVGVQRRWPDVEEVRLVWHYLAFDRQLVSARSAEQLAGLAGDTIRLIDEIESAEEFPPRDSGLCDWCEYPDLCPNRKHLYMVEALPVNEYMGEAGVVLVNRYVELREKAREVGEEMDRVREALVEYARREGAMVIRGSDRKVRVKLDRKLRFPSKNEPDRVALDSMIMEAGRWLEVSQLDTVALARVVEEGLWDRDLTSKVMKYGRVEETSAVYLSKLKEVEE
jgi:putative RecB family exonuclease